MKLLVIGAQRGSLGEAVAKSWEEDFGEEAATAGISGYEDFAVNMLNDKVLRELFQEVVPERVVVTIGMNEERDKYDTNEEWMMEHMITNCAYPMKVLSAWMDLENTVGPTAGPPEGAHFVAISSNSASIPRSSSMAYCASKAALSMAIRCAARDLGKADIPVRVYGYEPGLIAGTPMTQSVKAMAEGAPLTRMLGLPHGMPRGRLATLITSHLQFGGPELNGVLMRIDAGEV